MNPLTSCPALGSLVGKSCGEKSLNREWVQEEELCKSEMAEKKSKELNLKKKKKRRMGTAWSPVRTRQRLLTQNPSASVWVRSCFWEFGLFHIWAMRRTDFPVLNDPGICNNGSETLVMLDSVEISRVWALIFFLLYLALSKTLMFQKTQENFSFLLAHQ